MRIFLSKIHVSLMLQSVPFPLCACYFLCVTLHFVLPSYLECSVEWVEFICLCSIHCFRYYMIFLLKSIWNSFQTLYIDGLFSHLFHFTQIEFDDCNDVIILPLIVLVYVSLWSFTCIWLHAQWICDWFQPNEWMLKYCLSFDFVRFVLRDPSLGEKYQYLPKVVLLLPRGVPPTTWVHSEW